MKSADHGFALPRAVGAYWLLPTWDPRLDGVVQAFSGLKAVGQQRFCIELRENEWPSRHWAPPIYIGDNNKQEIMRR